MESIDCAFSVLKKKRYWSVLETEIKELVEKVVEVEGGSCPSMVTICHGSCFYFVPQLTLFILHYFQFSRKPMQILQITCRMAVQSAWLPPLSTPQPFLLTLCTRDILTEIPFFNIHSQHNSSLSHIDCG